MIADWRAPVQCGLALGLPGCSAPVSHAEKGGWASSGVQGSPCSVLRPDALPVRPASSTAVADGPVSDKVRLISSGSKLTARQKRACLDKTSAAQPPPAGVVDKRRAAAQNLIE